MKKIVDQLTVAIVTYQRPELLNRLLISLANQSALPTQILIIDNDIFQSAYKVAKQWQKILPIKYLLEKQSGAPHARNVALEKCQTRYLCFVDDDCVVEQGWIKAIDKNLQRLTGQIVYFQGKNKLLNVNSIWAKVQYQRYIRWFNQCLHTDFVLPLAFDTKNLCLDLNKIPTGIKFDSSFGLYKVAGSEDTDFGLKLASHKLRGFYLPSMQVKHQEISSGWQAIKKSYFKGRLEQILHQKWQFCDWHQRSIYQATSFFYFLRQMIKNIKPFNSHSWRYQVLTVSFLSGAWTMRRKTNHE